VQKRFPQVAHGRAQHFPRREPLRREIGEENGFDSVRAEAATARGPHDDRPQSADAPRGSDDAAWARGEERAAEAEGGIPGNRRACVRSLSREGESRRAPLRPHAARRLNPNARCRVRPQFENADGGERQAGEEHKRLQRANCRARTRKAESDLGQRNPFLGDSGR
jgi:hypothetical protein